MKTLLRLTLALFFTVSISNAQAQAALLALIFGDKVASENFNLGLKIGGAYTSFSDPQGYKSNWTPYFGLTTNLKLSDNWYLTPEFIALSKRSLTGTNDLHTGVIELDSLYAGSDYTLTLNYIEVPIIIQRVISDRLHIGAGVNFCFYTGAHATYIKTNDGNESEFTGNADDYFNSFDLATSLEAVYILQTARSGKGIYAGVRYTQGWMNVNKINPTASTTSALTLTLSFPFVTPEIAQARVKEYSK